MWLRLSYLSFVDTTLDDEITHEVWLSMTLGALSQPGEVGSRYNLETETVFNIPWNNEEE